VALPGEWDALCVASSLSPSVASGLARIHIARRTTYAGEALDDASVEIAPYRLLGLADRGRCDLESVLHNLTIHSMCYVCQ
jgi:hypothetical protein